MKKTHFSLAILILFCLTTIAQQYPNLKWEKVDDGKIPNNAVIGGDEDGEPFYIARAYYLGGLHPGKTKEGWKTCNIGYGGKEVELGNYEVLVYKDGKKNDSIDNIFDKILGSKSSEVAAEINKILNSYPENEYRLFLSDDENSLLKRKLEKAQEKAIKARCYDVSDKLKNILRNLDSSMPSRDGIQKEIEECYEIAKDC